jgi:hypothetical protein
MSRRGPVSLLPVLGAALLLAGCGASDIQPLGGVGATSGSTASGGSNTTPGAGGSAGASSTAGASAQAGSANGGRGGATSGGAGGNGGAPSGGAGGNTGAGSGGGGTGGAPPTCQNGKVVHFVYFVEADATFSEAQRADVEKQAFAFQEYWFGQLGVTFYLSYPVVTVMMAEHDANWYLTNPDGIHGSDDRWYRLGNVSTEVRTKLGITQNPNRRVVNYPTSRHDGRVGANFGGAWMDGDDLTCIADGGFNYPYPDGTSAHCTGHVAHEFGHILGLDHEGPQDDCMQYGFYTNDATDLCDFSPDNVAQILANPNNEGWFEAMPGELCSGG